MARNSLSNIPTKPVRAITLGAISAIPKIGKLVSSVLSVFWPEKGPTVWEQVQANVEAVVQQQAVNQALSLLSGDLVNIQRYLDNYNASTTGEERADWLTKAIAECIAVQDYINVTAPLDNTHLQLFPILVPLAHLHLVALREMYLFGPEIYNATNARWQTDLQEGYDWYSSWPQWYWTPWYNWRVGRISASTPTPGRDCIFKTCWDFKVTDSQMNVTNSNSKCGSFDSSSAASDWAQGTKTAMVAEAVSYMLAIVEPTFTLHQLVPWMETQPPIVPNYARNGVTTGPYVSPTPLPFSFSTSYIIIQKKL